MEYAVIETGGKQYKVNSGMVLSVERLQSSDKSISFDKVLLYVDGEEVSIGKPYLDGFTVAAKLLEEERGDKIRVSRFKAKSNYRRTTGHRQALSKIEIGKIVKNSVKSKATASKKEKTSK